MAEDRWGETLHTERGWALDRDSYTTVRVGPEFGDNRRAIFYEDQLPELRLFTWLLLDNLWMQEQAASDHGRGISDENLSPLIERTRRLLALLEEKAAPHKDGER